MAMSSVAAGKLVSTRLNNDVLLSSAPALQAWPELGEGAEFCAAADVDINLFFQSVGIVGGLADVFDVSEEAFEIFPAVAENGHAVSRGPARSPENPSLMSAERAGQAVAAAEEVDGAGLAVVLGEDSAVFIFALVWRQAVPGYCGLGDDFFPAELVGVPLGQRRAGVVVLHYR